MENYSRQFKRISNKLVEYSQSVFEKLYKMINKFRKTLNIIWENFKQFSENFVLKQFSKNFEKIIHYCEDIVGIFSGNLTKKKWKKF